MSHALRRPPLVEVHGVPDGAPAPAAPAPATTTSHVQIRSTRMHVMHEELARAHSSRLIEEAARERRAARLVAAQRAQRKAERAALRARHLLAIAVSR
ncbi:hypothetical protein D5H78_03900 [Vallicoccus soli]|uniref:Uncharacterized protein n=2 Tax=Vallicoccus soli TaxID=2339232 RepID=A0A3A3ZMV9_9ACTN|nr:hypothetical protein D5H78_03900 [Vallicoccus soli]